MQTWQVQRLHNLPGGILATRNGIGQIGLQLRTDPDYQISTLQRPHSGRPQHEMMV